MILSDKEIKKYIKEKRIFVEPEPDFKTQLGGASLDLRLGNEFRTFEHKKHDLIDPRKEKEYTKPVKIKKNGSMLVNPGEFILGVTHETVGIDQTLCARIDGKSSIGRMGIVVHSTAGHVNPGWKGKLTLEISNIGVMPVLLYPGMRICQLVFETLSSKASNSYEKSGKYMGQKNPVASLIHKEKI